MLTPDPRECEEASEERHKITKDESLCDCQHDSQLEKTEGADKVFEALSHACKRVHVEENVRQGGVHRHLCQRPVALQQNCREIISASVASTEHPWGVTFDTEFRASSCFLAGGD